MKRSWNHALILFVFAMFSNVLLAQKTKSVIYEGNATWAEAKLAQMSLDEKLGQLFMVAAYSNKGKAHEAEILRLVKEEHIGGLIFFQGGPVRQARLTNLYQQGAKTSLMIAMDAEWGLAMRLDSTYKFPWPMTVGATIDSNLAYDMGREIALHCKRLGVHINFGPVVDINTNPDNPIINARSFGENPKMVAKLSAAYMKGMQDQHVMASAKHFPGHGDTDSDSHKTLPTVGHTMDRLNKIELSPYQKLIDGGLASIMVAHLNVPAMDNTGMPSSLSPKIITDYLRNKVKFDGLVFTDALNMKGVADLYAPGEVDVRALLAGNDILLFSQDVPTAKKKIKAAIESGQLTVADIDKHVMRILLAKSWMDLEEKKFVEPKKVFTDLNPESSDVVSRRIFESATTVLMNKEQLIPVKELKGKKIACVVAGTDVGTEFYRILKKYTEVDLYTYAPGKENEILNNLSKYDLVVAGLYTSNASPWKSYKFSSDIKSFVKRVTLQNKTIVTLFANAYTLRSFSEVTSADAVIVAYQNHVDAESVAAQIIFGALGASGRLPVSASGIFSAGFGLDTKALGRLGYGYPGEVGINKREIDKIDILVQEAIKEKATPGCQVIVARKGKVIFDKSYGHQTYSKTDPIASDDIYDLASITKMAASLPVIIKLVEEGKIDLDKTLGDYLPELKGSNKEKLVIREVLAHQAGLTPWIPFYLETLQSGVQKEEYYSNVRDFNYPYCVADGTYACRTMKDTVMDRIIRSKLLPKKEYKYSDLGYYFFMEIIERIEGKPLNEFLDEWLYSDLGAATMTYKPLEKFPEYRIVPTERDNSFRKQELRGYVHDQGAAMVGGVAGHAGLFSNANDLAKLMQMFLNGGNYGGTTFFDSITLKEFTRCQFCDTDNRRGIGFDKPQLEGVGPTCGCVSPLSYGHTGFTGTMAWADPDEEIVYIFLSNRVHPDAENRKLLSLSTRTRIQKVIYNSITDDSENSGTKLSSVAKH